MSRVTHRIYITNINFSGKPSTSDEKELRKTSDTYNRIFTKRSDAILNNYWSNVNSDNFAGMINYIPTNDNKDIRKSSDILLYLYKNKSILGSLYNNCIKLITSFINTNKIKSIQLSGEDVDRLYINGIDIVKDIRNLVNERINIHITDKKYSSRGYYLV